MRICFMRREGVREHEDREGGAGRGDEGGGEGEVAWISGGGRSRLLEEIKSVWGGHVGEGEPNRGTIVGLSQRRDCQSNMLWCRPRG